MKYYIKTISLYIPTLPNNNVISKLLPYTIIKHRSNKNYFPWHIYCHPSTNFNLCHIYIISTFYNLYMIIQTKTSLSNSLKTPMHVVDHFNIVCSIARTQNIILMLYVILIYTCSMISFINDNYNKTHKLHISIKLWKPFGYCDNGYRC